MKKVLLTAFAAFAVMAMVSCNNNKAAEATEEPACEATEQCEKKCCKAEGDTTMCCKAEGKKCEKAESEKCCKAEGKECEKAESEKCCKAEGKECLKEAAK